MSEYNSDYFNEMLDKAVGGDEDAVEYMVRTNVGLIRNAVKRFSGRGAEEEDLFQIGSIGLLKAIRNFKREYNVCFSTYAVPMILGEIKRFLRDDGPVKVSRSVRELYYRARAAEDLLKTELGRDPTVGEVAARLGVDVYDLNMAIEALQTPESLYSTVKEEENSGSYLVDLLGSIAEQQMPSLKSYAETFGEGAYDRILEKISLEGVLDSLAKEEREVIQLRYFHNMTQTGIAGMLGISQVQVSRIEKRVLVKMREMLG